MTFLFVSGLFQIWELHCHILETKEATIERRLLSNLVKEKIWLRVLRANFVNYSKCVRFLPYYQSLAKMDEPIKSLSIKLGLKGIS